MPRWLRTREQDAQHAAQRLGGAPEQLVADRESGEVLTAHCRLAHAADRDLEPRR